MSKAIVLPIGDVQKNNYNNIAFSFDARVRLWAFQVLPFPTLFYLTVQFNATWWSPGSYLTNEVCTHWVAIRILPCCRQITDYLTVNKHERLKIIDTDNVCWIPLEYQLIIFFIFNLFETMDEIFRDAISRCFSKRIPPTTKKHPVERCPLCRKINLHCANCDNSSARLIIYNRKIKKYSRVLIGKNYRWHYKYKIA